MPDRREISFSVVIKPRDQRTIQYARDIEEDHEYSHLGRTLIHRMYGVVKANAVLQLISTQLDLPG